MKNILWILLIVPLLYFCSSHPELHVDKSFTSSDMDTTFAVLNFDYSGAHLSSFNANNAADQYASDFYIKTK